MITEPIWKRCCIHESGHAVMADKVGILVPYVEVYGDVDSDDPTGVCVTEPLKATPGTLEGNLEARNHMMVCFAGTVAEEFLYGYEVLLGEDDIPCVYPFSNSSDYIEYGASGEGDIDNAIEIAKKYFPDSWEDELLKANKMVKEIFIEPETQEAIREFAELLIHNDGYLEVVSITGQRL